MVEEREKKEENDLPLMNPILASPQLRANHFQYVGH
jgi:hypothetical protein